MAEFPSRRGSATSFPNEKIFGNLSKNPVNLSIFTEIYGNSISAGEATGAFMIPEPAEAARTATAGKCPGGKRRRTPRRGAAAKRANPPGYTRTPRFPTPQMRANAPSAPRPGAGRFPRAAPLPPPGNRRPTGGLSSIPRLREKPATAIAGRCAFAPTDEEGFAGAHFSAARISPFDTRLRRYSG